MRIQTKCYFASLVISFLILASLLLLAYYASKHQDSIFAIPGYVVAFFLSFPIFLFYGAEGNPPVLFVAVVALLELLFLSLPVYLILLRWCAPT
jgi:hypothetical protein